MSLSLFSTNRPRRRAAQAFRPSLLGLEDRAVPTAMVAPHVHLLAAPPRANPRLARAPGNVTINITGLNFTDLTQAAGGAVNAVGTITGTIAGQAFTAPVNALITPATTPRGVPILNLSIPQGIHLSLLGLNVDTSPICLRISAAPGRGALLGNLLGGLTNVLNSASSGDTAGALSSLNSGLGSPSRSAA